MVEHAIAVFLIIVMASYRRVPRSNRGDSFCMVFHVFVFFGEDTALWGAKGVGVVARMRGGIWSVAVEGSAKLGRALMLFAVVEPSFLY